MRTTIIYIKIPSAPMLSRGSKKFPNRKNQFFLFVQKLPTYIEKMKICEEKHILISDSGKCLFFHPKAKINLSWINFSEYPLAQKNIDA